MKTLKRNPWYIAAGCFLQMFLGMGLCSSFSMMLPEISAHTGISTGSISGNLTVAYLHPLSFPCSFSSRCSGNSAPKSS